MVNRLLTILKHFQLSPSQFADRIGVQRSSISHVISGRNNPGLDFIQKILKRYPEINPGWLIMGKGEMIMNGKEEPQTGGNLMDLFGPESEYVLPMPSIQAQGRKNEPAPDMEADPHTRTALASDKKVEHIILCYADMTCKIYYPDGKG